MLRADTKDHPHLSSQRGFNEKIKKSVQKGGSDGGQSQTHQNQGLENSSAELVSGAIH